MQEKVLVIPTHEVERLTNGEKGVIEVKIDHIKKIIEEQGRFITRDFAEYDEELRQVIPYVVMKTDQGILLLRRTDKQGEKRLHNKYSVGVGGHIRFEDSPDPWQAFVNGMTREINEEVKVQLLDLKYIGLINDTASSVSRVHVGLLYLATVIFYGLNEPDMFEHAFRSLDSFDELEKNLEGWSYLTVVKLKELMQS
ncbi:NUDIX domain-containing protein [Pseudothermotoga sp. U03pept]|uniref:NUDIX domain-containing protein n=1 Tax=Pseudothermotoga sp. U03pept TaxID=3447012 RepID=UPI003EFDA2B7